MAVTVRKGVALFSGIIKSNEICINLMGGLTIKQLPTPGRVKGTMSILASLGRVF